MGAILQLEHIEKSFAERTILRDIHIRLDEGEIVSLLGASGCGKSTLLRIAAGLDTDYRGRCLYGEEQITRQDHLVGVVFQEARLFPWLTIEQNIGFEDDNRADEAWVTQLLNDVGLSSHRGKLPKQLSGGQAQRVAIARGLYGRPKILLMDEPFSAVDPFTRMNLQNLVLNLARQYGIAVLLVTHDLDEAFYLSDRVVILGGEPGRVLRDVAVSLPHPRDRNASELASYRKSALDLLVSHHAVS